MVYGRIPRGPLAVLKENRTGLREMPLSLVQTTVEYLSDLRQNLEMANSYATEHGNCEWQRYISRYNLHAREKTFVPGEQVLILIPDSTSKKLNKTQQAWSNIEKETFATIWALGQFRNWIFGKPVTVFTNHNPITYLTDAAPKCAKLMRWALAIQQYDVTFCYKAGKSNMVADCLSRIDQVVTDKRH